MVGSIGYAAVPAAKWVVAAAVGVAVAVLYPLVTHRRPSGAEAGAVRAACATAAVDPRFVRIARPGRLGSLGVSYSPLVPGLGVVTVSEELLEQGTPELLAAGISLQAGRRRRRYLASGFAFAVLWIEYGLSLAVGAAAPAGTNWATAVPLGVAFGLGPLAVVGVGLWFVTFCRGVDRTLDRVGYETTLVALDRGRRGTDSRLSRYLYDRTIETLTDDRFGPCCDLA